MKKLLFVLALFTAPAFAQNHSVTLGWGTSSGATAYQVERGIKTGGPYTAIAALSTTTYTDTGIAGASVGATFYYVVLASNASGVSGPSNEAKAVIPAAAPPPPPPAKPAAPAGVTVQRVQ